MKSICCDWSCFFYLFFFKQVWLFGDSFGCLVCHNIIYMVWYLLSRTLSKGLWLVLLLKVLPYRNRWTTMRTKIPKPIRPLVQSHCTIFSGSVRSWLKYVYCTIILLYVLQVSSATDVCPIPHGTHQCRACVPSGDQNMRRWCLNLGGSWFPQNALELSCFHSNFLGSSSLHLPAAV